jgi:hypothetical protein
MFGNLLLSVEIFIFVFCALIVVKNIYKLISAMSLREKYETTKYQTCVLGLSLSYIITALIMGF